VRRLHRILECRDLLPNNIGVLLCGPAALNFPIETKKRVRGDGLALGARSNTHDVAKVDTLAFDAFLKLVESVVGEV
jgi:hypothetical protein